MTTNLKNLDLDQNIVSALASVNQGKFEKAIEYLEAAHERARAKPIYHFKIHIIWLQTMLQSHDYKGALKQILPTLFAIPVSVVIALRKKIIAHC